MFVPLCSEKKNIIYKCNKNLAAVSKWNTQRFEVFLEFLWFFTLLIIHWNHWTLVGDLSKVCLLIISQKTLCGPTGVQWGEQVVQLLAVQFQLHPQWVVEFLGKTLHPKFLPMEWEAPSMAAEAFRVLRRCYISTVHSLFIEVLFRKLPKSLKWELKRGEISSRSQEQVQSSKLKLLDHQDDLDDNRGLITDDSMGKIIFSKTSELPELPRQNLMLEPS